MICLGCSHLALHASERRSARSLGTCPAWACSALPRAPAAPAWTPWRPGRGSCRRARARTSCTRPWRGRARCLSRRTTACLPHVLGRHASALQTHSPGRAGASCSARLSARLGKGGKVRTQGQAAWQLSARLYERQEDICMRGMRSASAFAADKRSQLTDLALIMWAVSQGCPHSRPVQKCSLGTESRTHCCLTCAQARAHAPPVRIVPAEAAVEALEERVQDLRLPGRQRLGGQAARHERRHRAGEVATVQPQAGDRGRPACARAGLSPEHTGWRVLPPVGRALGRQAASWCPRSYRCRPLQGLRA